MRNKLLLQLGVISMSSFVIGLNKSSPYNARDKASRYIREVMSMEKTYPWQITPIEKDGMYHLLPGSKLLAFATFSVYFGVR